MKLFSYIGIAGTIWAGYIVLKNRNLEDGFADLKRRLSMGVDVKQSKPAMAKTIDAPAPEKIAKAVNDHVDWENDPKISSSVNAFTEQERKANENWPNQSAVPWPL